MGVIASFIGVYLPYITITIFTVGFIYRLAAWATIRSPVKIPVFPGQDSPGKSIARVLLDVALFRSLLRFPGNYILWAGSWIFHICFLLILLRHLRYFLYPVPSWVMAFQTVGIYAGLLILVPLLYLLLRRLVFADLRFISNFADYFALLLLISIASTGLILKFFSRVYVFDVKTMIMGLITLQPNPSVIPDSFWFLTHFFLVQLLLMILPFSKIMHLGGVFFSPTRIHYFEKGSHSIEVEE
jgi:nitrate reductase gamma subunit